MKAVIALCGLVIAGGSALAAPQVVTETNTYVMGDNDSRNDALQLCRLEAKRRVLDRAGALVESELDVKQTENSADQSSRLSEQAHRQARSYAAGILSAEDAGDKFDLHGDRLAVTCTVRVSFDIDEVRRHLQELAADGSLKSKVGELEKQIADLQSRLKTYDERLRSSSADSAMDLRQERAALMQDVDKAYAQAKARVLNAEMLAAKVLRGMDVHEVLAIAGQPRARVQNGSAELWGFGSTWVVFRAGVVQCIEKQFDPTCMHDDQRLGKL